MKKLLVIFAAVIFLAGCDSNYQSVETTGPVNVRSTKWGTNRDWAAIVVEYDNGYIKTLDKVCENVVGVWPGMRADISFSWKSSSECFHIISIRRVY